MNDEKQFYIRTIQDEGEPEDGPAQHHSEIYRLVPREQDSIQALEDFLNRGRKPADYTQLENEVEAQRVLQYIKTGINNTFEREAEGGQGAGYDGVAAQSSDEGGEEGESVDGPSRTKRKREKAAAEDSDDEFETRPRPKDFDDEIANIMRKLCSENPEDWKASAEMISSIKREGTFWSRWAAAGLDDTSLVNKIGHLRRSTPRKRRVDRPKESRNDETGAQRVFVCVRGCGFEGEFSVVEAHEQVCEYVFGDQLESDIDSENSESGRKELKCIECIKELENSE